MPTFRRHARRSEPFVTVGASSPLTAERALTGTTNQIAIADGGANGAVTLSAPQDLHTGASPTFAGATLSGTPLAVASGGTASTTASAARTALGVAIGTDVQAFDATLSAVAAYNTNGLLTQTAADTFAGRTITGTSNQISVSNGNGVAGNPTLSTPQNIHTGATPQFARLGINGANSGSYFFEVYATTTGSGAKVTATAAPASNSGGGMALEISGAHPTAANQRLGAFFFGSDDGVNKVSPAGVFAFSAQAFTVGSALGTYLDFETTANGSTTRTRRIRVSDSGNIAFGTQTPTAVLHLKAGTATASTAPLKLTSGTNLTTAEAGAVEYDGTNFFATNSTATRFTLAKTLTATATLNFGSIAASSYADLTITVTGAADGDVVAIGVPNGSLINNVVFFGWVSAADTVTIRALNNDAASAADPASGTFRATVLKY